MVKFYVALLLSFSVSSSLAKGLPALIPSPPQLAASSYLLVDVNSGQVIVESNADQRLPPASLTKMMTGYIASAEISKQTMSAEDSVPISVKAWRMKGSKMFIREGTNVPVRELLKGVIIQSGNDASVALAEFIAGDEKAFAEIMNQQAQLLGMTQTDFKNSTGWPAEGHLTTARDLSILATRLINDFPDHYALYSQKEFTYNDITQLNRNGLLWRDSSVDGLKTGWTEDAGYCLVASAQKKGMRLVSVVMGAKSERAREQETQKLLSYGFRYYETHTLYKIGQVVNSSQLWAGLEKYFDLVIEDDITLTIPRGERDLLEVTIEVDKNIVAPVIAGQSYGVLNIKKGDELLMQRNIVAAKDIDSAGFILRLWDLIILFFRDLLGLS
ncbi:MAG TPA: serine-type D-Ala-D-Ala carboxypeptidase [Cellvibrionales bacterium]|nr:serine-type D-Ala-D-Ala carboxypeptidase [Cellvibrionales bacterium]